MNDSAILKKGPYDKLKKAVYAAEELVQDSPIGSGREFNSVTEVLQFVQKIQAKDILFRGLPPIAIHRSHGNAKNSWADHEENSVTLADVHFTEQDVLHEIAHLTIDADEAAHSINYIWNYLDLTLRWRGIKPYIALRDALRETGVL